MIKIGHRGAKGYVVENTLLSFEKAIELGVDAIELDVHLCKSNEVVVIHDATIDRTTSAIGFVKDKNADELKLLGIPTLNEVILLVDQKCILNIEIKDVNATDFVVQLIYNCVLENNSNYDQFQISSFNWDVLEQVSKLNPEIQIGVLTEDNIDEALQFAKKIKAYSVNPFYRLLTKEKVTLLHENRLLVFPWTVNEPNEIALLKSFEVDGIISDFPDRL